MSFNFVGKRTDQPQEPRQQNTGSSEVKVKGIVLTDGPVLKENSKGTMYVKAQFLTVSDKLTPVMSLPLHKVNMVLRAFNKGCKLHYVPDVSNPQQVEYFLAYGANMINEAEAETSAYINNGFVTAVRLQKVYLEESTQLIFKVLGISSRNSDGKPSWELNHFGNKEVSLQLEVVAGLNGQPTVWKGANIKVPMIYAFKSFLVDGQPGLDWIRKPDGNYSKGSMQFDSFIQTFAPNFHAALYGNTLEPADVENLIPEVAQALDTEVMVSGYINMTFSKAGIPYYKVEWEKIAPVIHEMIEMSKTLEAKLPPIEPTVYNVPIGVPVKETNTPEAVQPAVVEPITDAEVEQVSGSKLDEKGNEWMMVVMNHLSEDGDAFTDSGDLTETGKAAAIKHLSPLKQAGLIPPGELKNANFEYATVVLGKLAEAGTLNEEEQAFVSSAHERLTEELLGLGNSEGW